MSKPALPWALAILLLAGPSHPATAAGDRELGQYLSSECVTCHKTAGRVEGGVPAITGWPEDQFVATMHSYRAKERSNVVMQTVAGRLKDDDIAALAAYFGSLAPTRPD